MGATARIPGVSIQRARVGGCVQMGRATRRAFLAHARRLRCARTDVVVPLRVFGAFRASALAFRLLVEVAQQVAVDAALGRSVIDGVEPCIEPRLAPRLCA